jgi:hypothetical protein
MSFFVIYGAKLALHAQETFILKYDFGGKAGFSYERMTTIGQKRKNLPRWRVRHGEHLKALAP